MTLSFHPILKVCYGSLALQGLTLLGHVTSQLSSALPVGVLGDETCQRGECTAESDYAGTYLLQGNFALSRARHSFSNVHNEENSLLSCTDLTDHVTYSSVPVSVGVPVQQFDVVIDTGSNSLLVPSCACVENGTCRKQDGCFTGENGVSKTYNMIEKDEVVLSYGSGDILASTVSELVQVAGVKAFMRDEVYLMNDLKLDFGGSFEGILGMGPPTANLKGEKTFVEEAGLARFSICMNSAPLSGALVLGEPPFDNPMRSIGTFHWGFDFRGISVGDAAAPVQFCTRDEMSEKQLTACGGIPDSGSTLMMGSASHIRALFADICNKWPRCATSASNSSNLAKSVAFQVLLEDCREWLDDSPNGIDEIPTIFLHASGANGTNPQTLRLPPHIFVAEMDWPMLQYVRVKLGPVSVNVPVSIKEVPVCAPNFAVMEYPTTLNGPVWIFGMPLFLEHTVGFDVTSNAMSIMHRSCEACGSLRRLEGRIRSPTVPLVEPALLARNVSKLGVSRRLRRIDGNIRMPKVDVSRPL